MEERMEKRTESPVYFEDKRKYPRYSIKLPLEYWKTDDVYRGGMVGNVSETGLLICSVQEIPVREELNVRIFFPNGYEFDGIRSLARIVWRDLHYETDWKGYKYGLEFIQISNEDHQKLIDLLRSPSTLEEISTREEAVLRTPPPEKPVSSPSPSLDSCQVKESNRNCLWERLKTKLLHLR
jgi:PilZ domain